MQYRNFLDYPFSDAQAEQLSQQPELIGEAFNFSLEIKLTVLELVEKILKTAELARRLETEKEKVLPFYENTTTDDESPEDLQRAFGGLFIYIEIT